MNHSRSPIGTNEIGIWNDEFLHQKSCHSRLASSSGQRLDSRRRRGKFTFYEFNTNEPIAKVFFCGSISSPRTEKVNDFNLSPFTLSREPVLRLRSGHSETTVHPEPVEGWCWLFTSSSQMIKQRFLDFFRNLKKLRRNSILNNKGKFEVFPSVTLWWGESVLVK